MIHIGTALELMVVTADDDLTLAFFRNPYGDIQSQTAWGWIHSTEHFAE